MERKAQERTGRVVALALVFFGGFAALGYVEGVFERLSRETVMALGMFATLYAALTYALDAGVRAWVRAIATPKGRRLRKAAARSPAATRAAT